MSDLPDIETATRDFLASANSYSGRGWRSYPEWVDGSRVLEFSARIIEAAEGWYVLSRFEEQTSAGAVTRIGPVAGLATAEAIVSELRKEQAAAVGRAFAALQESLDSFEYPKWDPVDQPTS
jgi:hypothetical protein